MATRIGALPPPTPPPTGMTPPLLGPGALASLYTSPTQDVDSNTTPSSSSSSSSSASTTDDVSPATSSSSSSSSSSSTIDAQPQRPACDTTASVTVAPAQRKRSRYYPLLGSCVLCRPVVDGAVPTSPSALTPVSSSGDTGRELAAPPARSGHSLVALKEGTLLLFGGGPDENVCNDVFRITVTGAGESLQAQFEHLHIDTATRCPYERDRHSAWVWRGFMYVFGGEDVQGFMYSDIWRFDHVALRWEEKEKGKRGTSPCPRRGQTCTLVGDKVWLFGGLTFERESVSDVYSLDMETFDFELQPCKGQAPCGRRGHCAVHLDGFLYIFGGCDRDEELLGDLWRLNLTTLVWEESQPRVRGEGPPPTVGHSASIFRGMLLTFGGNISSGRRASCSEVWLWDPTVRQWQQLLMKEEPRARSYHSLVPHTGGEVLAFGGWSGINSKNDMMCISVGSDGSLKHAVSEYILRNRIEYKPKRTPSQPPLAPSVALSTANQQCAAPLGTEEGSRPSASPSR